MAIEVERLVAQLEARIDKYEKNLEKAGRKTDREFTKIEKRGKQMEGKLAKIGKSVTALGLSLAGGLFAGGVAGTVAAVGQVADEVARIGDEAKRSGLGIKEFQELRYVAKQNRVSFDALTDGLKEMNLRADEFISTGSGSAAEAFKRLGYSATELNEKLKDPSALFSEIIGKLQQFDQAAQIRIMDEIFGGTGGEQFVQLIEQGEAGLNRTVQAAHDLGYVLSTDTIEKADELNRRFDAVATTVGNTLKAAIVDATIALTDFIDSFREVEARSSRQLEDQVLDIGVQKIGIESEIARMQGELARAGNNSGLADPIKHMIEARKADLRALIDVEMAIIEELESRRLSVDSLQNGKTSTPPKLERKVYNGAADSAEREAKAIRDLIVALEMERDMIGLTAREQQVLTSLRRLGVGATDEQRAQVRALAGEIYDLKAAQDAANESFEQGANAGKDFFMTVIGGLKQGKSFAETMLDAVGRLIDKLASAALDQLFSVGGNTNPLVQMFSALFGGGWRTGGYTGAGGTSEIAGPVHRNEYVFDAEATRRIGVDKLEKLRRNQLKPSDLGSVHAVGQQVASGGHIQVSSVMRVENGQLVPLISEISGQVAGQMVKQSERGLPDRIRQMQIYRQGN